MANGNGETVSTDVKTGVKLDPNWKGRRKAVWAILTFDFSISLLAVWRDPGTGALAAAVLTPIGLQISLLAGSYIFGAAWELVKGVGGNAVVTTATSVDSAGGKVETTTTQVPTKPTVITQVTTTTGAPADDNAVG